MPPRMGAVGAIQAPGPTPCPASTTAPSFLDRDLRIDIYLDAGDLRDASIPVYHHKGLLIGMSVVDPHANKGHLGSEGADTGGTSASSAEARKRVLLYARPGHVSFAECRYKLSILALEGFAHMAQ